MRQPPAVAVRRGGSGRSVPRGGRGGPRRGQRLGEARPGADRGGSAAGGRRRRRVQGLLSPRHGIGAHVPPLSRGRPGVAGPPDGGMEGGTAAGRPRASGGFHPGGRRRRRLRREERGPRRGDAEEGREAPGAQAPRGGRLPFAVGGAVRGDAAFHAREGVRDRTAASLRRHRRDGAREQREGRHLPRAGPYAILRGRDGGGAGGGHPVHPRRGLLPLPDPHPASRSRLRADAHHRRLPELLPVPLRPVRSPGRPRFRRGGDGPGDVRLHDGAPCPRWTPTSSPGSGTTSGDKGSARRAGTARTAAPVPSCRGGKAAPRIVARGTGRGTRAR